MSNLFVGAELVDSLSPSAPVPELRAWGYYEARDKWIDGHAFKPGQSFL